jgi:hypothetical protein
VTPKPSATTATGLGILQGIADRDVDLDPDPVSVDDGTPVQYLLVVKEGKMTVGMTVEMTDAVRQTAADAARLTDMKDAVVTVIVETAVKIDAMIGVMEDATMTAKGL